MFAYPRKLGFRWNEPTWELCFWLARFSSQLNFASDGASPSGSLQLPSLFEEPISAPMRARPAGAQVYSANTDKRSIPSLLFPKTPVSLSHR